MPIKRDNLQTVIGDTTNDEGIRFFQTVAGVVSEPQTTGETANLPSHEVDFTHQKRLTDDAGVDRTVI